MKRPTLKRWSELTEEARQSFLGRVPQSNWPEDFNAQSIWFYADGSGYRDEGAILHVFQGRRHLGPPGK